MCNHSYELQRLTQILIGPEDNYREITQSVDDLYQLYLSASGIDIDTDGNREVNRNIHKTDGLSGAAITDKYTFPEVEVEIPKDIDAGFSELCLFTEIQIFEDIYLNYWDCSLTLPKKILNIGSVTGGIKKVKFRYEMGNPPEFIYSSV